jgi:hypothetical protein
MMPEMKLEIAAALAFIAWLLLTLPLRAEGPVVVPGTADVVSAPAWDLLVPPLRYIPAHDGFAAGSDFDLTAPVSRWIKVETFPTEQQCRASTRSGVGHDYLSEAAALFEAHAGPHPAARPDPHVHHYSTSGPGDPVQIVEQKNTRCVASDDPRLKE